MSSTKIKFDDVSERIWFLEAMGNSLSSKDRFLACEKVAPFIAPSNELIEQSKLVMTQSGPTWDTSIDTSLEIDIPDIIMSGVKNAVFMPTPVNDMFVHMVEKFSLWNVH